MNATRVPMAAFAGLAAILCSASSQVALAQANPGVSSNAHAGVPNNAMADTGDIPGSSVSVRDAASAGLKGAYGLDLSQRIAQAQKLVDDVNRGKVLSDSDTRRIRNLIREDFVAWNKRYDLLPSTYKMERDRWLVDAQSLSPSAWALQRLKWLQAQRDWVLAHGG